MPGTNSDPLVRALAYLSILRFFAAIPSAIVLRHYFNKPGFKSPHFALVWYQTHFRGIIFLIVALFTALWRTGLSPNPLAAEDADPLVLMLSRTILSTLSVIDVAYGVWLVKLLKTFNKRTQAKFVVMHPQVN
ncbi:hypothetical protein DXG01_015035 [Tephrocybe rancida]|nr:hypothetical protein DXG01_015035 [Tephrocybe rancida]